MIETIRHQGNILAIIVRSSFSKPGVHFFTPEDFSQQLAYMTHPQGKKIAPHLHATINREVSYTQEVLFIRKGKLLVSLYDQEHCYLESKTLAAGDVIILASGGHGFEVLEDLEMFEVKQGPYTGQQDKIAFVPHEEK